MFNPFIVLAIIIQMAIAGVSRIAGAVAGYIITTIYKFVSACSTSEERRFDHEFSQRTSLPVLQSDDGVLSMASLWNESALLQPDTKTNGRRTWCPSD